MTPLPLPSIAELRWLQQHDVCSRSTREKKILDMEHFLAYAHSLRRVRRPWLHVNSGARGRKEGGIDPDRSLILIGSCSWLTLLHEWYHWIVGERHGWSFSATHEVDVAAEAYARANVYIVRPNSHEARDAVTLAKTLRLIPDRNNLASLVVYNIRLLNDKRR